MLVIRREQMQALAAVMRDSMADSAREYLRDSLAAFSGQYSERELQQIATFAVGTCRAFGIERQIDVFRWLNLMFALGFEFYRDPAYPWAREVLEDPKVHPDAIAPWLTDRATRYLGAVREN